MKKKLILFGAVTLTAYCVIGLVRADEISLNGHTEPAECHTKQITVDPDFGISGTEQVCLSESFICVIQGGSIKCEIKR